jgi:hypothetical protein
VSRYVREKQAAGRVDRPRLDVDAFVAAMARCMHCGAALPTADDKHVVFDPVLPGPLVLCLPCWGVLEPMRDLELFRTFMQECSAW